MSIGAAARWKVDLVDVYGNGVEFAFYCPDCAEREFGQSVRERQAGRSV